MLELIKYIVGQFAEDKEHVDYVVEETEDAVNVTVLLSDSDMGKVIGKQGKIAKALRTLVRAATPKGSKSTASRSKNAKRKLLPKICGEIACKWCSARFFRYKNKRICPLRHMLRNAFFAESDKNVFRGHMSKHYGILSAGVPCWDVLIVLKKSKGRTQ